MRLHAVLCVLATASPLRASFVQLATRSTASAARRHACHPVCVAAAVETSGATGEEDAWLQGTAALAAEVLPSGSAGESVLSELRAAAAAELRALHFPARKDEAWRRTDISLLRASRMVAPAAAEEAAAAVVAEYADESSTGMRLVLVDGVCSASLSDLSDLPAEVSVGGLLHGGAGADGEQRALSALRGALPEAGADHRTALGCHVFAALNQASLADVAAIAVPDGVAVPRPLHVLSVSTGVPVAGGTEGGEGGEGGSDLAVSHPSVVIALGAGAQLHVLQQYAGVGAYFTNAITRVAIGEGGTV